MTPRQMLSVVFCRVAFAGRNLLLLHPYQRDVLSSTRTHMRWMCVHAYSCVVLHTSPLPPHHTVILVHHASTNFGLPNFNMLEYTCHIVAEKHIFSQKGIYFYSLWLRKLFSFFSGKRCGPLSICFGVPELK